MRQVLFSVRGNRTQCLTLAVEQDVIIELKYSQNFCKRFERVKKSARSVFQKAFLEFAAVLYLWAKSVKITRNRSQFQYCCWSSTCNSTKKWILTPQVELSFFVQHAEHQSLLLKRYTHYCQCEQVVFWLSHKNIILAFSLCNPLKI